MITVLHIKNNLCNIRRNIKLVKSMNRRVAIIYIGSTREQVIEDKLINGYCIMTSEGRMTSMLESPRILHCDFEVQHIQSLCVW